MGNESEKMRVAPFYEDEIIMLVADKRGYFLPCSSVKYLTLFLTVYDTKPCSLFMVSFSSPVGFFLSQYHCKTLLHHDTTASPSLQANLVTVFSAQIMDPRFGGVNPYIVYPKELIP